MSLVYNRLRIFLDLNTPFVVETFRNYVTQDRPKMGYNRAVAFEVAVGRGKVVSDEAGNYSAITLVIKPTKASGEIDAGVASLLEKTVAITNTTLTQSQWTNDSGETPYHAILQFPDSETVIDMTGAVKNAITLGIAITGMGAAGRTTLGSGLITLQNDGAVITGGVVPVATRLITDAEIHALLSVKVGFTGNPPGAGIELQSAAGKKILDWVKDESDGSATKMSESL